jgi:hypothetical protein
VHRNPPPTELGPFVEYRRVPDAVELFADSPEERLLKLGFWSLELLDKWPHVLVP